MKKLYLLLTFLLVLMQARSEICSIQVYSNGCETPQILYESSGSSFSIYAGSNYGFHFSNWNDGNTSNPRTISVTQDSVFTAFFSKNSYNLSITCDASKGIVLGAGSYLYQDTATVSATPKYGYRFTQWSDGSTENPRKIAVIQDIALTALFATNTYEIKVSCNSTQGKTTGSGMFLYLKKDTLSATPQYGYHFTKWNDGNTSNPRIISVERDSVFTALFAPNNYQIRVSCNSAQGSVAGAGTFEYQTYDTISATPKYGYHFTGWNDGVTYNPRWLKVTRDSAFTAQFAANSYSITTQVANNVGGTITGAGTYDYLSTAQLIATPSFGYKFVRWADGSTINPRSIKIERDTVMTAYFTNDGGKCGNNLYWTYNLSDGIVYTGYGTMYNYTSSTVPWNKYLSNIQQVVMNDSVTSVGDYAFYGFTGLSSITWSQALTTIGGHAFDGCTSFSTITIPNKVTTIGEGAFANCTGLRSAIMGTDISNIGTNAFSGDTRIYDITCYAASVPVAEESSFANYNAYLHIPCNSQRYYTIDPVFGKFGNIECIGSEESTTSDFTIQGGQNDATFQWPTNSSANSYTMTITKDGVVFCTLTFNANGQLMNIAFAPSRGASSTQQAEQTAAGYKFTVTGLDAASQYGYTFKALDNSSQAIATYTGTFNTEGYTVLEDINAPEKVRKFIKDGKLYIIRNGQTYDASGREVK